MTGALDGLRIVALEQAVAAPFATARLADAGALVEKFERPGGDFARGYDAAAAGQSSYFVWLNRGKVSIVADLMTADGMARLKQSLAQADVLVCNLKPGALGRMGLGADVLRADYPRLIVCSITGYGETGPLAQRKAYDLLVQAESGLSSITGGPDGPARVGTSVVDIATGATAHAAILEALIARGISGTARHIAVSLFDVMAEWLTVPLLNHEAGQTPQRNGLRHPSIAPYGVFDCADGGQVLISIQSDREWAVLCDRVLGAPDLAQDSQLATNVARVRNRDRTDALVGAALGAMTAADAVTALDAAQIAFARVNDMQSLSQHPHLRRITLDTPNGSVALPAPGAMVAGDSPVYGPVPALPTTE
ncbi:CaiB/BaiF CoA-transferase family protein [Loktanella sp. SALINAS62]|uniref:CaiB/BaiF CoA transferase family protein n=1 Tax=Loktanella sp. SALINAS62 TaxID=2706124 RepID=UPI0020134CC0|nr:CaiB/BaiF CoA-transferase family protein [Loktanella sp. SALINAS62]MBS1300742.1 CoA transferase [Loktanella sp. SALINAS62]